MDQQQEKIYFGILGFETRIAYVSNRIAVCEFGLGMRDGESINWIKVKAWRELAKYCHESLKRGQELFVKGVGKLKSYKSKEGPFKEVMEVTAKKVALVDMEFSKNNRREAPTFTVKDIPF